MISQSGLIENERVFSGSETKGIDKQVIGRLLLIVQNQSLSWHTHNERMTSKSLWRLLIPFLSSQVQGDQGLGEGHWPKMSPRTHSEAWSLLSRTDSSPASHILAQHSSYPNCGSSRLTNGFAHCYWRCNGNVLQHLLSMKTQNSRAVGKHFLPPRSQRTSVSWGPTQTYVTQSKSPKRVLNRAILCRTTGSDIL